MPSTAMPAETKIVRPGRRGPHSRERSGREGGTDERRTVVHARRPGRHEARDVLRDGRVGNTAIGRCAGRGGDELVAADVVPVGHDVVVVRRGLLLRHAADRAHAVGIGDGGECAWLWRGSARTR